MMKIQMKGISLMIILLMLALTVQAAVLRGTITDKATKEPLIGAAVQLSGTNIGTITDVDGNFELAGLRNGTYKLIISYVSYCTQIVEVTINGMFEIKVELEQDNQQLGEVVVVADAKKNTENAIITQQRTSLVMQTGVSAQQITKTQDKDASEVIRRVSGISIIEEKFVMVRGLSQRYNNVWINNSAVPSSEADARAFSFDIIPSSQLDNMLVVKSPAPEYPADFSGGFILVNTKDVPSSNLFTISVGTSLNDQTHFKKFLYNKGSGTDFLGFDNGFRSLKGGINAVLNPINNGYDLLNNGLNNDWTVKDRRPLADLSMNMNFSRRWVDSSGRTLAMLGTVNYSNSYKTYLDMDNNLFGAYDTTHDCSNYLRKSIDDQYNHNVRIGTMLNFTYVPASGNSRYEFKNIFNQLGNVLVVDNIDNANKISKKINNKYKIVTLDGEIINVGGSITGGTVKKKSIISEKYELENLLTKKDMEEKEILSLKQKQEEIDKNIKQLENILYEIGKNKILLTEEYNAKNENYKLLKNQLDRITLELNNLEDLEDNSINEEEEKILKKYYEVLKEKELVNKKIILLNEEKEKVSSLIEEYQAKYRLNNSNVRNLEEKKKTLEIESSKMSVKMDNLLNILSETYQMTFEKAKANYVLEEDIDVARKNVNSYKKELKEIGIVNLGAIEEYERVSKRYEFLTKQDNDLEEAITTLLKIINELDSVMEKEFIKTFKEIEIEFNNVFKELFKGGSAKLKLTDESNILETGVNIEVSPPGKKITSISLLSGGEKTLTAISLLFAVLNVKKIPFCLFDEVEAALDEANVDRVGTYFNKYIGKTQLIIITHKKKTMEYANTLYGITMQESGVSKLVSVKLVD